MPTGGCMCGEVRISFTGEPVFRALCHCRDDRKMSNVQTWQIPKSRFEIMQGTPREWEMRSDQGNEITNHFCATCSTVLFRTGSAPVNAENIGLRAGVLDDQSLLEAAPAIEVYSDRRLSWVAPVDEAIQLDGRYKPIDAANAEKIKAAMAGGIGDSRWNERVEAAKLSRPDAQSLA